MELFIEFIFSLGLEFLFQGGIELSLDALVRKMAPGPPMPETDKKLLKLVAWCLLGVILGFISVGIHRTHLVSDNGIRMQLVFLVPILCGSMMAYLGGVLQKKQKRRLSLEHFSSACGFAFFFGLVRFVFCR